MFHGCLTRGIPIIIFCTVFISCVIMLLCFIISYTKIKNKQSFKKITKEAFLDFLDECPYILWILAFCFVLVVITIPISYSKTHAFYEAQFYYKRCVILSEEINKVDENNENLSEELKSYSITLIDEKMKEYKKAKKNLDYWYERTNE